MKIAILVAALLIITSFFGDVTFSTTTKNLARTRMLLHLLGDSFTVKATIAPLWGEPTGVYQYRDRIHHVSFQVSK